MFKHDLAIANASKGSVHPHPPHTHSAGDAFREFLFSGTLTSFFRFFFPNKTLL